MLAALCQAGRTLTAFTVVILTVLFIWYLNPNACAAYFFNWQGLFPMQVRRCSNHHAANLRRNIPLGSRCMEIQFV